MIAWFYDMMLVKFKETDEKAFEEACRKNNDEKIGINLQILMNGVEINPEEFFVRLEEMYVKELAEGVDEEVRSILTQEVSDNMATMVGAFSKEITEKIRKRLENDNKRTS